MIFKRIFVYFVFTILVVTISLGMVIFSFLGSYVIDQKESMLLNAGERISEISVEMIKKDQKNFDSYFELFSQLSASNLNGDILLVDVDGKIVFNTKNKYKDSLIGIPEDMITAINEGQNTTKINRMDSNKDSSLIVGVPMVLNKKVIGGIFLITFLPEITRLREDVIRVYLISGIIVL